MCCSAGEQLLSAGAVLQVVLAAGTRADSTARFSTVTGPCTLLLHPAASVQQLPTQAQLCGLRRDTNAGTAQPWSSAGSRRPPAWGSTRLLCTGQCTSALLCTLGQGSQHRPPLQSMVRLLSARPAGCTHWLSAPALAMLSSSQARQLKTTLVCGSAQNMCTNAYELVLCCRLTRRKAADASKAAAV